MILLGGPVYIETKNDKKIPSHEIDHNVFDPELAARAHQKLGYRAAYAPCIPVSETALINKTKKAFKKHGVVLAELGFWKNLQSLNEYERMQNIDTMCEILASADELGAACAVDTIGSYSFGGICDDISGNNFSDDFFVAAVENARYIINHVKPKTAKFTYENFALTALDSLDQMEKMMKAVDSPSFGIHLDVTNLVTCPREFFSFNAIVKDAFRRFGDKIVSCHIKDLRLVYPASHIEIRETAPGDGMLDMACYLGEIDRLTRGVPCMMEHLDSEEDYDRARENVLRIAEGKGYQI